MAGYIHGVEIKTISAGTGSVTAINTSIVGLIGIAEKGTEAMVTSLTQAKEIFGEDIGGTTIISALKSIWSEAGGTVCYVKNVASESDMASLLDTSSGKPRMKLVNDKYASQVYEASPATGAGLKNFQSAIVSGFDSFLVVENKYGIKPKILISPGFSQIPAVASKMLTVAKKLRAKTLIDVSASTVTAALTARGATYTSTDNRVTYCYPRILVYNEYEEAIQPVGFSQLVAAGLVYRDKTEGYWYSPSSYEMVTALGTEVPIVSSIDDDTADTNLLNAQGIVTVFRTSGTGFKIWGNWTAGFPSVAKIENQIAASRVKDVVDESVQWASLNDLDKPITAAWVDNVKSKVNQFVSVLKGRGAMYDGECTYEDEKNDSADLALGKVVFSNAITLTPTADIIIFESVINTTKLNF